MRPPLRLCLLQPLIRSVCIGLLGWLITALALAQTPSPPPDLAGFRASIRQLADTAQVKKFIAYNLEQQQANRFSLAVLALDEALAIAQRQPDKRLSSEVYRAYARWSLHQKAYPQAIHYLQKALSVLPANDYPDQRHLLFMLIGNTYYKALDPDRAKSYYLQIINARKPQASLLNKAYAFGGMANLADQQHDARTSVAYNQQALPIYQQLGQKDTYYACLMNLAVSYSDLKRPAQAIRLYRQCLGYANRIEKVDSVLSQRQKASIYANLPYPLIDLRRFDEAEKYARLALVYADKDRADQYTHRMWIYDALTRLYEEKGEFSRALAAHKQWAVNRDSIQNQARTQAFAELETGYQAREKEGQINQLNAANAQQNRQLWASAGGLALLAILLGTLFWQYRRLGRSRTQIQQQANQLSLMMKELHHRVKNNLAIVSSLLKLQSNRLDDEKAVQAVRTGQQRVEAMSLIHQRLYQTDQLTSVNMGEYLTDLAESLMLAYNYSPDDFDLIMEVEPQALDVDVAIPLGLIANELITNAFKYAYTGGQRPRLRISLHRQQGLTLEVQDNGPGIDLTTWQQGSNRASFGKRLITSLSEGLDGQLACMPQEGALFRLHIPPTRLRAA